VSVFDLLELEEQVGRAWHRLAGRPTSCPRFPDSAVDLVSVRVPLGVFFRALGGDASLPIVDASAWASQHRLSWRQRLAMSEEKLRIASVDDEALHLPTRIDCFPDRPLNRDLYFWLAAFLAVAGREWTPSPADPLQADLTFLRNADRAAQRTCARFPGLREPYERLCRAALAARPSRVLPDVEAAVEAVVILVLGGGPPNDPAALALLRAVREGDRSLAAWRTPHRYRRLLPPPVWGVIGEAGLGTGGGDAEAETDADANARESEPGRYVAERAEHDQATRDDPLVLNRFEKILGWSEMVNVNRATDDEDAEAARRAADDLNRLSLSRHQRKAATRLKLDLDVRPRAGEGAALGDGVTYPEWDFRISAYRHDHCRVIECMASAEGESWQPDAPTRRRIRQVRRQFEALRPRRVLERRQLDGFDLDTDAAVRSRCELRATGIGAEQIFEAHRANNRDLAVGILVDASLSTDGWVDNRRVLDVEKEALTVLAHGLAGCGDSYAIYAFSSRGRELVRIETIKAFDGRLNERVLGRIAALRPGAYTRIGAALRHVAGRMIDRPETHRLILLLTDGKPNDMDHYEGRYGVEDTRKAVGEARRSGIRVFAITIDRKARDYVPYLFGRGAYGIISHVARLPSALPVLYRHLTS
jgi:nitric oxide reductase NorD protein